MKIVKNTLVCIVGLVWILSCAALAAETPEATEESALVEQLKQIEFPQAGEVTRTEFPVVFQPGA